MDQEERMMEEWKKQDAIIKANEPAYKKWQTEYAPKWEAKFAQFFHQNPYMNDAPRHRQTGVIAFMHDMDCIVRTSQDHTYYPYLTARGFVNEYEQVLNPDKTINLEKFNGMMQKIYNVLESMSKGDYETAKTEYKAAFPLTEKRYSPEGEVHYDSKGEDFFMCHILSTTNVKGMDKLLEDDLKAAYKHNPHAIETKLEDIRIYEPKRELYYERTMAEYKAEMSENAAPTGEVLAGDNMAALKSNSAIAAKGKQKTQ